MNFYLYLILYAKINLKWIIDPSIKLKTLNLLKENIGESLCDFWLGKDFFGVIPKAKSMESDILKVIKIKSFYFQKDIVKKVMKKTGHRWGENIFKTYLIKAL